jgi:hypothetical protein
MNDHLPSSAPNSVADKFIKTGDQLLTTAQEAFVSAMKEGLVTEILDFASLLTGHGATLAAEHGQVVRAQFTEAAVLAVEGTVTHIIGYGIKYGSEIFNDGLNYAKGKICTLSGDMSNCFSWCEAE